MIMKPDPKTGIFSATRRNLLKSIPLIGIAPHVLGQATGPAIAVRKLNSFEIRVSDPYRTQSFYQDLFGMPVQARYSDQVCLRIGDGPQHMAVRRMLAGETPAITHLGYSVDNYDLDGLLATLDSLGYQKIDPPSPIAPGLDNAMKCWVSMHGNTPQLFFSDARGLIVQLSDVDYCGGNGPLGDQCVLEAAPPGMMKLKDISHFTAFVNDGAGANTYYQDIFGLSVQAYQGPNSPVTGIGDGYQFVMYAGSSRGGETAPASINHGCFSMEDFDVDRVLSILTDYGLKDRGDAKTGPMMHYISLRMPNRGGAEGGTPELYFTDPDGVLMQLQSTTYCGGGGKMGEICLNSQA